MAHASDTFQVDTHTELGSGGYGKVVTAVNKKTGEKVAAKIISTTRMKQSAIEKEIGLMEKLSHPNIIGLRGKEVMGKNVFVFMEMATGGELFSRVINSGVLQEDEARPYLLELMNAVQYMHQKGVVHRDLKLENVLLEQDHCKVCDFGLAHVYGWGENGKMVHETLKEVCGSKSYCAPEVLEGRGYDGFPTDVWSCGICLFAMLAGFFPLDEASGADWRFERVKLAAAANQSASHAIFGFYDRKCELSEECTALIDAMLRVDPVARLTVDQVLSSPWVQAAGKLGAPAAVYRGGGMMEDMDAEGLRALLAQESDQPLAPLYRGGGGFTPGNAPPLLCKQVPMFCDEFHIADGE